MAQLIENIEVYCNVAESSIIACSTPVRQYDLKDFIIWSNNKINIGDSKIFENALLDVNYVVNELPITSFDRKDGFYTEHLNILGLDKFTNQVLKCVLNVVISIKN